MASDSPTIPLREFAIRITKGTTPSTLGHPFVDSGINFIKSESITSDGFIDASKFAFIDAKIHQSLARSILVDGDVLFSMAGVYLGKTAVVSGSVLPANTNQAVGIIRLDKSKAIPSFVHYALKSPKCQDFIRRSGAQSAQPNFNLQEIGSLPIPDLPLFEQEAIARILGVIDDKINLIGKSNQTFEVIARAIFKSWFVDFDPVLAKAEGREPEGMDAATAALFPNEFCETERGSVPQGWRHTRAGNLMVQSRDSVNPLRRPDELFEHFSLPAFDEGKRPKWEYGREIKSNKTVVPVGSILLSKLNPHIPRVWLPAPDVQSHAICSTEFLVLLPEKCLSTEYLFCQFTDPTFVQEFGGLTTGTSNSHQRVKVDYLFEHPLMEPEGPVIEAFTSIVRPMFDRMKANIEAQHTLAELRDTLLPRLISGKLRVPEAEKMVEAVL